MQSYRQIGQNSRRVSGGRESGRTNRMNNQKKYRPIDLNDYNQFLTPYKKDRDCYHCPNCDGKLSISRSNGEKFSCYAGCDRSQVRKAILELAGENGTHSDEWESRKAAREQERLEAERIRLASLKAADERHSDWLDITGKLQLSDRHRQDMLDRGWTPEWIEKSNARSTAKGRVIPVVTADGLMVGGQVILGKGQNKPWYGSTGTNHLLETDELPLTVVYPNTVREEEVKDKTGKAVRIGYIAYTESTGDKPWLCAQNFGMVTIGSSNIGCQPKDLIRSIEGIKAKYGWNKIVHVLMADGGSAVNKYVLGNYTKLHEQLPDLQVGWWGQYTKSVGDIDEIPTDTQIAYIPFEKFERYAVDRQHYVELSQLSIKPTETRNERYLSAFTPTVGHITFVSSACATGKTERMASVVTEWKSAHPDSRVIDITQLNSIRESHQERLGLPEWRVGHGQDDSAINSQWGVSLCVDSLLRLQLESIPARSLIIIDEAEAVLKHLATAGTLGSNAASIQAHFTQIIDRVLVSGGAVVCLEDDLTDLSVKGMSELVGNRYPRELIVNTHQPFKWDVSIGGGDNESFLSSLLARLVDGERVFMPTSSQRNGEAIERLVVEKLPDLAGKIVRLDAKTSLELTALLADPNGWMTGNDVRLFIGSPTIQSGFNLSNNQFDRTVARFTNLDTRAQIQMLHRDRSDAPRDIFTTKRGAEAGGKSKSAATLERINQDIANRATMAAGAGRVSTNRIGDVWNSLNAKFAARETLSAAYLEDYLRADLAERGHIITAANWQADERFNGCWNRFKQIKEEILIEENKILFAADGRSLSVADAVTILHSSGVPFEVRQKARKTLLHDELPGVEFSEEFLMEAVTRNRGEYLRACKLNFFLDKPELARSLDKDNLEKQLAQPHLINSRVPKLSQKIDLLAPIAAHLEDLASGREYKGDDPAVVAVQEWLVKNNYLAWVLFGLNMKVEQTDSIGKRQNSSIATVNKILKKLGYKSEVIRKEGSRSNQVRVFGVTNSNCEHRQTIYQALTQKYESYNVNSTQLDTVVTFLEVDPILKNVTTVSQPDTKSDETEPIEPTNSPPHPIPINRKVVNIGDRVLLAGEWVTVDRVDRKNWIGGMNDDGCYIYGQVAA
jgi:hypothetical protein